jgi:hypothetical protein
VGIKVCADQDPSDSGLYINSLPGVSLESIEKTATEDQETYLGLWADVQTEAWSLFVIDFREAISECFELSKRCDYEELICENKKILVNAWRFLLGSQLMLFRINTTRLNRFSTIDAKQAEKMVDHYQVQYEKALLQAAQLCDISACRCELVLDPKPKSVQWLP